MEKLMAYKFTFRKFFYKVLVFFAPPSSLIKKVAGGYYPIFQVKEYEKRWEKFIDKTDKKQKFAFVIIGGTLGMYVDIFLAIILRLRGHYIHIFYEDSTMPLYEIHRFDDSRKKWMKSSQKSAFIIVTFLRNLKFHYTGFSECIITNKVSYIKEFDDILEASLLRHYRVGILNEKLVDIDERIHLFKETIKISQSVGLAIVKDKYDCVIMNHGLYSSTGPCRRVIQENQIDVLTHDRAKRRDCFTFAWNKSSDSWDVDEEWENLRNRDLTQNEREIVLSYINTRVNHSGDRLIYNFGMKESPQVLYDSLDLDRDKPIYTLFTNVLWDAASSQREIAFKNPVEWVIKTIEWFCDNPDKQLLIKIHPAEVVIGTKQPFKDVIDDYFTDVPENVKIIDANRKINSWSILSITNLGLVHTSTVGMELGLLGVPCCVVSRTHFRDKGFTVDVNTQEDYFDLLKQFKGLSNNQINETKKIALKYAYLLFEKYQYYLPFLLQHDESQIDSFICSDGLVRSTNHLIDSIENHRFIQNI